MASPLHRAMTATVTALGHPASLIVLLICGIVWRVIEPESFDLHAIATLVAVAMTLIIQRGRTATRPRYKRSWTS